MFVIVRTGKILAASQVHHGCMITSITSSPQVHHGCMINLFGIPRKSKQSQVDTMSVLAIELHLLVFEQGNGAASEGKGHHALCCVVLCCRFEPLPAELLW